MLSMTDDDVMSVSVDGDDRGTIANAAAVFGFLCFFLFGAVGGVSAGDDDVCREELVGPARRSRSGLEVFAVVVATGPVLR